MRNCQVRFLWHAILLLTEMKLAVLEAPFSRSKDKNEYYRCIISTIGNWFGCDLLREAQPNAAQRIANHIHLGKGVVIWLREDKDGHYVP